MVRRNVRLGRVWERRAPALVAAAVALAVAAPVAAAPPGYVSEMPSAAEVLAKVSHGDRVDTWARRYATFERLVGILGDLEGPREFDPTPAERRIGSEYRAEIGVLAAQVPQAGRSRWFKLAWGYEAEARFNRELMMTYFSPRVRAAYSKTHAANLQLSADKLAAQKAAEKAQQQAQRDDHVKFPLRAKIFFGVLVVLVGLFGARGGRWIWVRW